MSRILLDGVLIPEVEKASVGQILPQIANKRCFETLTSRPTTTTALSLLDQSRKYSTAPNGGQRNTNL
jgi:hypothetical protein